MNAKEKFVPQRRFKKFKNGYDWEKRKLCNIVTNISDGDWIESQHIFNDGEYRIIQTGNLGEGIYIDKTNNAKFFYQKDFNQLNANEIFPGDILISRLAEPAGRTIILPNTGKRMVTSVDVTVIRPDDQNFDSMFLMTQMNSSKVLNEVNKSVAGTTHKRVSRKNLEQIDLYVPHLAEQTVLGAFFKQIDNIIDLQKNKLDKSKELKSAYLSEMFPAEGERKPKRRFAGFTDDWEQRKLKDLADKVSVGIATSSSQYFSNREQGVPFIKNQNIKENWIDDRNLEYISQEFDKANSTKRIQEGDILTVRTGYPGLSAVVPKELVGAQTFTTLITRLKKGLTIPEFVSIFINSDAGMKQILGMEAGGAQKNVNAGILQNLSIPLPSLVEQKKISNFVIEIDKTIALHQHKLEKLKNIKQAFLNELFV